MLEVDSANNIFYTKGDTGSLQITLTDNAGNRKFGKVTLQIYNERDLDSPLATITKGDKDNENNHTGVYILDIDSSNTIDLIRQRYIYRLIYKNDDNSVINTFVGGGKTKTYFWVT